MFSLHFLLYGFVGIFSGFIANLFGLGGGLIVVPWLVWTLPYAGVNDQRTMHMAIATSLVVMLFNTSYATFLHFKKKNILLPLYKKMIPFAIIGAFAGALLTHVMQDIVLRYLYIFYLSFNLYITIFRSQFFEERTLTAYQGDNIPCLNTFSFFLGGISALLGIGGGMLSIPFLRKRHLPMRYVTAMSVALALPVALIGSTVYIASGFIYWPACIGIALGTLIGTKIAISLAPHIPDRWYAKLYVLLLCIIILAMWLK